MLFLTAVNLWWQMSNLTANPWICRNGCKCSKNLLVFPMNTLEHTNCLVPKPIQDHTTGTVHRAPSTLLGSLASLAACRLVEWLCRMHENTVYLYCTVIYLTLCHLLFCSNDKSHTDFTLCSFSKFFQKQ